jgi:hypothetical protein
MIRQLADLESESMSRPEASLGLLRFVPGMGQDGGGVKGMDGILFSNQVKECSE